MEEVFKPGVSTEILRDDTDESLPNVKEGWYESAEYQARAERINQFLCEYTEEGEEFHVGYRTLKNHYFSWCRMMGLSRDEYSWHEILDVLFPGPLEDSSFPTVVGMRMKRPIRLPRDSKSNRKSISNAVKKAVYAKLQSNRNICELCKQPILAEEKVHIDHILPVSKGGTDDLSNLQVTHALCNLSKGRGDRRIYVGNLPGLNVRLYIIEE